MNINKTQIRTLLAIASGRVSAAQNAFYDLTALENDINRKLKRAEDALDSALKSYENAKAILESIEDSPRHPPRGGPDPNRSSSADLPDPAQLAAKLD